MKYLNIDSYNNSAFPDFKELCQKFANRYLIHINSQGTYEYTGEFIDELADAILKKYHSVQELTEAYDTENNKLIPYSVEFEKFAINNGNWMFYDRYGYCEFYDNKEKYVGSKR